MSVSKQQIVQFTSPSYKTTLGVNAQRVVARRYSLKDIKGNSLEQWDDIVKRVVIQVAKAEKDPIRRDQFTTEMLRMMDTRAFVPNTPCLVNAGKPKPQMAACFVLPVPDSLEGIMEHAKYCALIHQSGGGCISADARVWSTFCGLETIEVLFNRATADGRAGVANGNGLAYDVSDLDIRTASMNPATGETGLRQVTHVWKFDVPATDQIVVATREGVKVQTSRWHPFMVLRGTGFQEVRADELRAGDVILTPEKPDDYWPWREYREVRGTVVDAGIAWLIGFTLGDGSFGYLPSQRLQRLRLYSGTTDVLEKAREVIAKLGTELKIYQDKRGLYSLNTLNQGIIYTMLEACGLENIGPKDTRIRVPEIIAKSPLDCVRAFLAGLFDSDGYVDKDGSPSYTTASAEMAEDVAALCSLLGYQPRLHAKQPHGKGRQVVYTVQLCILPQVNRLAEDLKPYLANEKRRERLQSESRRQLRLHVKIEPWRERLQQSGLAQHRGQARGQSGACAEELNRWSCDTDGRCNRDDLSRIANLMRDKGDALGDLLHRVAEYGIEVEAVSPAVERKDFYDLSVAEWNTYAAGTHGMAMIHNTGMTYERLRPAGTPVGEGRGMASGPVSFMQIVNTMTETVKQGGVRRGANMGILRCLAGGTMISTIGGRFAIRDLVGTRPYLYCTDGEKVRVRQTDAVFSNGVRETIRVWFDDDSYLDCTPDHRILLADRQTYCEAGSLQFGESVATLHKRLINDRFYLSVTGTRLSVAEHVAVAEMKYGQYPTAKARGRKPDDTIVHHLDHDPLNKVVRIESLGAQEVFDISLPEFHNFAANGVFVHNCTHPDILRFVHAKNDQKSLTNFNISVTVSDEFLRAVENNEWFQTEFEDKPWDRAIFDPKANDGQGGDYTYNGQLPPKPGLVFAPDIWERIISSTHRWAEPGIIFIDNVNRHNPLRNSMGPKRASNPCAEEMLHDYNACNLGSIDVAKYYDEKTDDVDWNRFSSDIYWCVRFLDNVIDTCDWPLPQIHDVVHRTRPVGLGIMGFADLCLQKRVTYGSEESAKLADRMMDFFRKESWRASLALGAEKGVMPELEPNRELYEDMLYNEVGLDRSLPLTPRNYEVSCVAPTGTISLVAETSSGCEPNFSYAYVRRDTIGTRTYAHPIAARALGLELDNNDQASIERAAAHIVENRDKLPAYFVDVMTLTPDDHLRVLKAFQDHVDNSISKTVNAPSSYSVADTDRVHRLAWKMGVKAVSYYRDGSRDGQVLTAVTGEQKKEEKAEATVEAPMPVMAAGETKTERPRELTGSTWQIRVDHQNLYVTINHDGERVLEVFATGAGLSVSVGLLASKMLRGGFGPDEVAASLNKVIGSHSIWFNARLCSSPEQVVAECIMLTRRRLMNQPDTAREAAKLAMEQAPQAAQPASNVGKLTPVAPVAVDSKKVVTACPECGSSQIEYTGGCYACRDCGFSKCV